MVSAIRVRSTHLTIHGGYAWVALEKSAERVRLEFQDKPAQAKKAIIYLGHRFSGLSLKEIGRQFGIKESAVSQPSRVRAVTGRRQSKGTGKIEYVARKSMARRANKMPIPCLRLPFFHTFFSLASFSG